MSVKLAPITFVYEGIDSKFCLWVSVSTMNRVLRKPLPSALPRKHQPSSAFFTKMHAIKNLRKHPLYNQGVGYYEE